METELLIQGTEYIYINSKNEQIKVKYLGEENNGMTFFKFRNEDGVTYSLFQYEVEEFINKIK